MRKNQRHDLIKQIINDNEVERQDDIVRLLHEKGIEVTQATISRDIKELQLIKVAAKNGGVRYSFPKSDSSQIEQRFFTLLSSALISIRVQEQFLYIDLRPGNGASISATLKQVHYSMVFAAVSDDNGVLVICKDHEHAVQLKDRITRSIAYI
jgi:transcriptional regulator of arginine metabolism